MVKKHVVVHSDWCTLYPQAQAGISLGLKHRYIHHLKKHYWKRAVEYVKDITEDFDDYYPCRKKLDRPKSCIPVICFVHISV